MHCTACNRSVERFEPYGLPPRPGRCPHCGAKPRTRAMLWYLGEVVGPRLPPGARVLEVGPSRVSARLYPDPSVIGAARYVAVDVRPLRHLHALRPPHAAARMDVTRLGFADASFDLVICDNALPYVVDDRAALAEMRRCVRADGVLVLNTHRERGPTLEAAEHRRLHPELDDAWYAENGDARVYGDDYLDRLRAVGLTVRVERLFADRDPAWLAERGLKPDAECVVAFRSAAAPRRAAVAISDR